MTAPTEEMFEYMKNASIGDDVYGVEFLFFQITLPKASEASQEPSQNSHQAPEATD
jgi:hypothetical protein